MFSILRKIFIYFGCVFIKKLVGGGTKVFFLLHPRMWADKLFLVGASKLLHKWQL
jgi:hypothetical protein